MIGNLLPFMMLGINHPVRHDFIVTDRAGVRDGLA